MAGQNKERNYAMNKILIIDDDRELCALIKRSVQSEHIEADFCNTGKEGLQKLKEQEYQLVVLDVMMPGMDGFETLEEIRKENSLPILMFTSKNDSISKVRGLRAGADDYLTKPFGVMELISRVKALLRRSMQNHEIKQMKVGEIELNDEKRQVKVSGEPITLTYKEYELLKMLMSNTGIVLQREDIMVRIWGMDYEGESRTLDMHIKTLRHKLGDAGKKIRTVRNVGYQLEE